VRPQLSIPIDVYGETIEIIVYTKAGIYMRQVFTYVYPTISIISPKTPKAGNTEEGSIIVLLTFCLTGLD